jgi:ribonuclease HII
VHHRSFFAPVVAAREKHFPSSVPPDLFSLESQASIDIPVAI